MEYSDKQIQIMEAAEFLFSEKGFDGTSVRDIAERANVNLAMISYYFGSKEKLMEALFKYRNDNIRVHLESMVFNEELTPLDKFYQLIDYFIERFQKRECFHRIMVREQIVISKGHIGELILNFKKVNLELIRKLVHEGQKTGQFKKNIDVSLMVSTLIGSVNHVLTTPHYYRELNGLQDMSDDQFAKHIRKKLSHHLKSVFKATLTHE